MTLIGYDNLGDTYDEATRDQRGWSGGGATVVRTAGRVSGYGMELSGNTGITPDILAKNLALGTEFTRHIAVQTVSANGSDLHLMSFLEGATSHVEVYLSGTTRFLRIKRNGTTVVTGTHALTVGTWHQIVIHIKVGDAATGQVHTWVDEVADISDTTSDFKNGGTGVIDNFTLRGAFGNKVRYDDMHDWSGNDNKGNSRVLGRVAMADGFHADWTPLSGTDHFAMVDDNPPDEDTTYVYSDTTANRDSYQCQPLGIPAGATIMAVGVTAITRKLDVGSRSLAPFIRTGGTDFDGTTVSPSFDWNAQQAFWELNPDTVAAWTVAEVDATEAGILDDT
jgi:hypothetical protein